MRSPLNGFFLLAISNMTEQNNIFPNIGRQVDIEILEVDLLQKLAGMTRKVDTFVGEASRLAGFKVFRIRRLLEFRE